MSKEDKELLRSVIEHAQPSMRVVGSLGRQGLRMDPEEGRRTAKNYGEEKIKSAKTSVSSGDSYHLYVDDLPGRDPNSVVLEMRDSEAFTFTPETSKGGVIERLSVEISNEAMDKIALDWIEKRKLR